MSTYHLEVAGLSRELPICQISDQLSIAAFIMLGDPELCVASAKALLEKCPEFDVLLTAETKGIPLAHEMARQSGKRYVVARKGEKLYMPKPVVVTDKSITTAGEQKLVVDQAELDAMNGKRVLIDGGDVFRDFLRRSPESRVHIKDIIEEKTGVRCPIGPYTPPKADQPQAVANVEELLARMQAQGVDVIIEEKK